MRQSFPLCVALATLAPFATAQELPQDRARGGKTINQKQLRQWLTKLTSPEFAGRGTGQPGFQLAAEYMRDHFKSLGLEPAAKGQKYFQPLPFTKVAANPQTFVFAGKKNGKTTLALSQDDVHGHLDSSIQASGRAMVAVVRDLDDSGLDETELEGTVLFLLVKDEGAGPRTRMRGIRNLQNEARRSGAAAVVLADARTFQSTNKLAGAVTVGTGRAARGRFRRPNNLVVHPTKLDALCKSLGKRPAKLHDAVGVVDLGAKVHINIETKKAQAPAYNVIATLPGSDPKLKDEYVVIGCHLDHLGNRNGTIYPGADDDGSGSASLMAISQAFAKNNRRPKRSVMFVAFCAEEMGLIGSRYFSDNPPIPLENIVTELQIDMVGRDETGQRGQEKAEDNTNCLHLIGTKKLSNDLHELCLKLNEDRAKFDFEWDEEGVFYRSDHWNFAKHGVPIAFFFTGFHRDYHRPTDTVEKINFAKMERIDRYIYDLGYELADADQRPLVDADKWQALRRKGRPKPAAPVRK